MMKVKLTFFLKFRSKLSVLRQMQLQTNRNVLFCPIKGKFFAENSASRLRPVINCCDIGAKLRILI